MRQLAVFLLIVAALGAGVWYVLPRAQDYLAWHSWTPQTPESAGKLGRFKMPDGGRDLHTATLPGERIFRARFGIPSGLRDEFWASTPCKNPTFGQREFLPDSGDLAWWTPMEPTEYFYCRSTGPGFEQRVLLDTAPDPNTVFVEVKETGAS